jgi:thymidylate synthase (FAD)
MVRHRIGAFSQESLRYVRLTDLGFYIPSDLNANDEGKAFIQRLVESLEFAQRELAMLYQIDSQDIIKTFSEKKKLTSAFRRVAPIGLGTSIVWTTNLRNLRHVIQMRTDRAAEEEMRLTFGKLAEIVIAHSPMLFSDFIARKVDGHFEYSSIHCSTPYDQRKYEKALKRIEELEVQLTMTESLEDPNE